MEPPSCPVLFHCGPIFHILLSWLLSFLSVLGFFDVIVVGPWDGTWAEAKAGAWTETEAWTVSLFLAASTCFAVAADILLQV